VAAQDPYRVAGDHYHLIFENAWARATRVTYGPHETAPVHDHPPTPTTVYVYVTDGGVMRFHHVAGEHVAGQTFDRAAVKAGRTDPLERPTRDVRLRPVSLDPTRSAAQTQFENAQVRIIRVMCAAGEDCPLSEHPGDPAVVVIMSGPRRGQVEWSPTSVTRGPAEEVRIELKTKPVQVSG
jgi:hypothetical protein